MQFENNLEFARQLDNKDPLKSFRDKFHFPNFHEKKILYFTGNSLGLQPKKAAEYIQEEQFLKRFLTNCKLLVDKAQQV